MILKKNGPKGSYAHTAGQYRDQPWFSVFKHSMDHEEGV